MTSIPSPAHLDHLEAAICRSGFSTAPGLSHAERREVEAFIGARFPPDLAAVLGAFMPAGKGFPNWRLLDSVSPQLGWPLEGLLFDVENNSLWPDAWGRRPEEVRERATVVERAVQAAPRLIPIYAHRYLPADPCAAGNTVLSVYQTDIIVYGADLWDYFAHEFCAPLHEGRCSATRPIRFWSDFLV